MSKPSDTKSAPETAPKTTKSGPGGARPGAGRPPGKSEATKRKEARLRRELKAALADMTDARADALASDPFEALTFILRTHLKAGDLTSAAGIAKELLPFTRPKLSSSDPMLPLPADMEPDAPAQPDEELPPGGIIDPTSAPRLSANADGS